MKLFLTLFFLLNNTLMANDSILGYWLSENEKAVIEVYKKDAQYFGKMVWLRDQYTGKVPNPLDINNDDQGLQKRKLIGLDILTNFKFKNDEYIGGQVYDPESGNTYTSYLELVEENKLKLRGYVGIPLFGRSSYWLRQKSKTPDDLDKK